MKKQISMVSWANLVFCKKKTIQLFMSRVWVPFLVFPLKKHSYYLSKLYIRILGHVWLEICINVQIRLMVMYTISNTCEHKNNYQLVSAAFTDLIYDCLNCALTNDITQTALSMFQLFLSSSDSFLLKQNHSLANARLDCSYI
jgi:hypothetical protein